MDPARVEALLEARDHVHRLARRLLRDEHGAEDLAQQSLAAGLAARDVEPEGLRSYLAGVARHLASRERRTRGRRAAREARVARTDAAPSSAEIVEREEWRRRVVRAVQRLGPAEREVVLLRFFEGLPPRRIARHLGLPVETVKTRLKRGVARLRAELSAEHGPDELRAGLACLAVPAAGLTSTLLPTTLIAMQLTKLQVAGLVALVAGLAWVGVRGLDAPIEVEPNEAELGVLSKPAEKREAALVESPSRPDPVREAVVRTEPEPPVVAGVGLSGRVLAPDGQPVGGAEVVLSEREVLGRARTDARGEFVLADVKPPYHCWLGVTAEGYAPHVHEPVRWSAGDPPLVIELERALALAGVLLDEDGSPAVNAWVGIEGDRYVLGDAPRDMSTPQTVENVLLCLSGARTGADGRFRFDGLRRGAYELSVVTEDEARIWRQVWSATAGDEALVLRLDPARDAGVTFEGTVRDAISGAPIQRFTLSALGTMDGLEGNAGSFNSKPVTLNDPEGRYRLGGFEPMELGLFVRADGYRDTGFGIEARAAGVHQLDIELSPVRALEVVVVDERGDPVGEATLMVYDGDGRRTWMPSGSGSTTGALFANSEGRAVLQNLPAERIAIEVYLHPGMEGPGGRGERSLFRFELDLGHPIEGIHELVLRAEDDLERR